MQRLSFQAVAWAGHARAIDAGTQRTGVSRLRSVFWRRQLLSVEYSGGASAAQAEIPRRLSGAERESADVANHLRQCGRLLLMVACGRVRRSQATRAVS